MVQNAGILKFGVESAPGSAKVDRKCAWPWIAAGRPLVINAGILALGAGLAAQVLKVVIEFLWHRRWRPGLILANGGMPSSHTATVTALAMVVIRAEGWFAPISSLVLVFGLFVVFEATGLRQEMGHQAAVLNDLTDRLWHGESVDRRRLRELVGHTWAEVVGGAASGVVFVLVWWRLAGP
jgi:acid phosphatase family membrane protein YuiD